MSAMGSIRVLAAGAVWRLTGARTAGNTLLDAVGSGDENEQTLAGMMLVRAGDRSVSLIEEARSMGAVSLPMVDVLTSIGSEEAERTLEELSKTEGETGEAAQRALRDLDAMRRREP